MSLRTELDAPRAQPPQVRILSRRLCDLLGDDHPSLDYRRPESWRDRLDSDVQHRRWQDWTASLEPSDSRFHGIPDGLEEAWCAALDYFRWDYLRLVHGADAPKPDLSPLRALPRDERDRVARQAYAMWASWGTMRGRPWAIICHARDRASVCHEIDFYRRRAGKRVAYVSPTYSEELLDAAWAKPKRRRAA